MCGDDDDLNQVDEDLYNRFLDKAGTLGVAPDKENVNPSLDLNDQHTRSKYMEDLFKAGLKRSLNDADCQNSGDRMDMVAGQAIVFARLAGILAGQLPPESDMFHSVINSLMDGHKEARPGK